MSSILSITFPFFALIAAGYAVVRWRALPAAAIPGLNVFVLYFALPCMLYRFGAGTPIAQLLDAGAALAWGVSALVLVGAMLAWHRRTGLGWNDSAFGALAVAFPNTGFMGVPLIAALLGASAAGPVIITIVVDMVLTSSLCIALSRLDLAGAQGAARAVRQALRGVLRNPMPWAILLGALASALQFTLPGPIERTVAMLADATSPVALFTIGALLARQALTAASAARTTRVAGVGVPVLAKLVLHPLLVGAAALAVRAVGVPLGTPAVAALVLVAALPSAGNVSMLAERFGADSGRVARIILWTTVAAFLSYPLAAALVQGVSTPSL